MQFVLRVQVGCPKNCLFLAAFFRSISSTYIIWSFILNCSSSPPSPHNPVSPLLSVLPNLLLPSGLRIRAYRVPFLTAPHVSASVCVCAHKKPACRLISFQTCHFFVSESQSGTACPCMFQLPQIFEPNWINVFRAGSAPFFISDSSFIPPRKTKESWREKTDLILLDYTRGLL